MNDATQKRIDRLLKSARNARDAKNRAQREAARTFLITRADELREDRDAMEAKLDRQWDWLDAHPDDARYPQRELQALELLHDYEAVCDALHDALGVWQGREAA